MLSILIILWLLWQLFNVDPTKDWTHHPWQVNVVEFPCFTNYLKVGSSFSIKAASGLFTNTIHLPLDRPPGIHARWVVIDWILGLSHSYRLYRLWRVGFIAWCLRHLKRGMPTEHAFFGSVTHEFWFMCGFPQWNSLAEKSVTYRQLTYHLNPCWTNSQH